MALSSKDTYNLLSEMSEFGCALFYLCREKDKNKSRVHLHDLEAIIYKDNMEQVSLCFPKLIQKIDLDDLNQGQKLAQASTSKRDFLIGLLEDKKITHPHLQEIKDIAFTDRLADDLIDNATYMEGLNLRCLDSLLQELEKKPKNDFISTKETLSKYRLSLTKLEDKNLQKILHHINQYYISMITE